MDYKKHIMASVSKFLQVEMTKRNMTNGELANKINEFCDGDINISSVRSWKNGDNMPRADKILILADVFGTSTDEILGAYDSDNWRG